MKTNNNYSNLLNLGTRLVILAAMLMGMVTNVSTVFAAPSLNLQSVTVSAQSGTLTYGTAGSATFTVTVTRSSGSPNTITMSTAGLPAGATSSFTLLTNWTPGSGTGSRTYQLTINKNAALAAGSYNFNVQASGTGPDPIGTGTLTVAKANQTITFGPLADKTEGNPDFNVSATASSGLAVSFSASGSCTVAGTLVHLTSFGSCTITASQAGNTSYNTATSVQQSFTINPSGPVTGLDLYAMTGSTTLPNGASVPVWGYSDSASGTLSQPGGPVLYVNQGDVLSVTLHNVDIPENTALLFLGQSMIPDLSGVGIGGSKTYTFTASQAGTFLYEAGLIDNSQHQVGMGMYGALVVRPATAGQAYGASTAFDEESVLVLSEIDPSLNNAADPAAFDMRNYHPRYWLINGKSYPQTDSVSTAAGHNVLLRYVNAGLQVHSMSVLGMRQSMIAIDGNPLNYAHTMVAESIGPGRTMDTIVTVPASAGDGSKFAVYEASFLQHNNNAAGFGGMFTFLNVSGTPPTGDTTGPATSGVSLTTTSVSATISDAGRGDSNIAAAEFFIDTTGANGTGTAMTGAFTSPVESVSGVINPALTGTHTVYVHGQDSAGNWGPFQSAVISNDTTGPTTSALSLSPASTNGTVNVTLSGTANDTASGGSNIATAEYTIDGGFASPMSVSPSGAKVASLSATISAATVNILAEGTHVIAIRSQDSLGNWGAPVNITLTVDKTGPATSGVSANPNPSNGLVGFNSSTPAIRVTASFSDTASNITAAEGFIDAVGANGTGFPFIATDGIFNSFAETGYADIPLTTIRTLSDGNHTLYVHSKDAAGNWGNTSSMTLTVDKTAPVITGVSLTPNTAVFGAASITLNVSANDGSGVGVGSGQYWIDGTATPPAGATMFAGTSTAIGTSALAGGVHTVYVRMQDAVGNWSTVSSASLFVIQAVNDNLTITSNNSTTQTVTQVAPGVLANDLPIGQVGRTATLVSGPVRIAGSGAGTIAVTLNSNGSYTVTLTGVGNNNNQRRTSKQGTYQFTYTMTLNGVTSTATVTIVVQ